MRGEEVLWLGAQPVAALRITGGDFPWFVGTLIPREGAALLRWTQPDDRGAQRLDEAAMTAAGWPPETWRLVAADGELSALIALVRSAPDADGTRAVRWRFGLWDDDSEGEG